MTNSRKDLLNAQTDYNGILSSLKRICEPLKYVKDEDSDRHILLVESSPYSNEDLDEDTKIEVERNELSGINDFSFYSDLFSKYFMVPGMPRPIRLKIKPTQQELQKYYSQTEEDPDNDGSNESVVKNVATIIRPPQSRNTSKDNHNYYRKSKGVNNDEYVVEAMELYSRYKEKDVIEEFRKFNIYGFVDRDYFGKEEKEHNRYLGITKYHDLEMNVIGLYLPTLVAKELKRYPMNNIQETRKKQKILDALYDVFLLTVKQGMLAKSSMMVVKEMNPHAETLKKLELGKKFTKKVKAGARLHELNHDIVDKKLNDTIDEFKNDYLASSVLSEIKKKYELELKSFFSFNEETNRYNFSILKDIIESWINNTLPESQQVLLDRVLCYSNGHIFLNQLIKKEVFYSGTITFKAKEDDIKKLIFDDFLNDQSERGFKSLFFIAPFRNAKTQDDKIGFPSNYVDYRIANNIYRQTKG